MQAENKMVILGEMRELGADSTTEHQRIISHLATMELCEVWLVGQEFCNADCSALGKHSTFNNVEEVKKPELNAKLVAENIGFQLGKRMNFRRAVKMALQSTMNAGAKGVRIEVSGRLNGAEMSRREKFIEGSVPLHTLRADIDFHCHHAPTIAGIVGVKVWIYKGEK